MNQKKKILTAAEIFMKKLAEDMERAMFYGGGPIVDNESFIGLAGSYS